MDKLKAFLGYAWAAAAIIILGFMVILSQAPEEQLNSIINLKVSARVNGGEISRTIDHRDYQTILYKPVFEGIFADRKDGFVQIKWETKNGKFPEEIREEIDYNNDGEKDFIMKFMTKTNEAELLKYNPEVADQKEVMVFYDKVTKGVRVSLRKQ